MTQNLELHFYVCVLVASLFTTASAHDLAALNTMGNFFEMTQAEFVKSNGIYIRTAYKHGCLDSGFWNFWFRQVYGNENCPLWTWLRWSFQGPVMIAHKPFMRMCLECSNGRPDCVVGTASCTGDHSQKWSLGLHLNRTTAHGDVLFSIHNHLYPHQCVTIESAAENGLVLNDCFDPPIEEQLFYLDRDWFAAAIAQQKLVHVRDSDPSSARHEIFRL